MALVNPQIAMSYRPTVEYQPRNALAEYAQIQQIMGGQRQAEVAEMQLESLRRERDALGQIQAAIVAKGGPPDLEAAADAMIKSGKPEYLTQGMAIRTALRNQREAEAYRRDFGGGATPAPAGAAAPANAMAAPAAAAPVNEPVAAPIAPPTGVMQDVAPGGAVGPETPLSYLKRQFGTPGAPANALAPTAVAAAPVNAMVVPDPTVAQRQALEARLRQIGNNPELKAEREMLLKQYESLLSGSIPPAEVRTMQMLGFPATAEGYRQFRQAQTAPPQQDPLVRQYEYAKAQGFPGSLFDYKRQIAEAGRPPAQPRAEPAPRTKEVTLNDGTLGIMNMDTGAITRATVSGVPAKGKPSAFAEKTAAQRVQLEKDLTTAISELKDAAKPGGLIDQSTGSGAGRLVDVGARFVGKATPGDIAIGKLAPIADLVLKMVPRFEGPQSDKDTKSYKEAAGQLADATLPREIRKQAANTIVRLMENRKGQFVSKDMAAEGAGASSVPAPPPGFTPDKQ